MEIIQSIILGAVQGITEFLPISSSGHLLIFPRVFGWQEQGIEFDAAVHLATLLAVFFYFWKDLKNIVVKKSSRRLGWIIVAGSIPAFVFGFILKFVPEESYRSNTIVIISLIGWGIVMYLVDSFYRNHKNTTGVTAVSVKQGIYTGLAQAIALIPGTSRSGITITAGLAQGLDRPTAARFSFLLGIPTIAAAGGLAFIELLTNDGGWSNILNAGIGLVSAFITGYFSIKFMLGFLEKHGLWPFALYRVLLGAVLIYLFIL
ncbi:MAG: undecaprenyl-diphosphatase UppP [Patescibacteria group bacterium]|nr:undecaprenyl-diphosphatase UppP [Patescibacteria group bacterium]